MLSNLQLWWFLLTDRDVNRDPQLTSVIRDRLFEGMEAAV